MSNQVCRQTRFDDLVCAATGLKVVGSGRAVFAYRSDITELWWPVFLYIVSI